MNADIPSTVTVYPTRLRGTVAVPSSKSHTIRALLIAACASGRSVISNALSSADAHSCIAAVTALGAQVAITGQSETGIELTVEPPAGGILRGAAPIRIDVGNSGTTLYLLTALAAVRPGATTFDGDASIRRRSAAQLLGALHGMGAEIAAGARAIPGAERSAAGAVSEKPGAVSEETAAAAAHAAQTQSAAEPLATPRQPSTAAICAPYTVTGPLAPGKHVTIESPTSQYLSAVLLAAPLIEAPLMEAPRSEDAPAPSTTIDVALLNEHPYIDMTCWWLDRQEIRYTRSGYDRFVLPAGQRYRAISETLPGDYSSATFWFCAAAITGSSITVSGLARDDVQGDRAVLDILAELGVTVTWADTAVTVSGKPQRGGRFDLNALPDALPALTVLGTACPAPLTFYDVAHARAKETDRIAVMREELEKLGATVTEHPDGLTVYPATITGGTVESHDDHRVAMALAIVALRATDPVTIERADAAAVTYPGFFDAFTALGGHITRGESA